MLRTKCIIAPIEDSDGLRISIMSRHTLNDSITPHPQITSSTYDLWMKPLAPPAKLVGDYYKRGLPLEEFKARYLEYIRRPEVVPEVQNLAQRALEEVVTILCIEPIPEPCHRKVLAEECKRYEPGLVLNIR